MSKNKGSEKKNGGTEKSETVAAPRKQRAPQKPRGTLVERMVAKADLIYTMITLSAKQVAEKNAPSDVIKAANDFVAQAEIWREKFFGLKTIGWNPVKAVADKGPVAEGDSITIASDQKEIYNFIDGLMDGTANLVAGTVLTSGKKQRVLVKARDGRAYGFVQRSHLVRLSGPVPAEATTPTQVAQDSAPLV
jgi:hypothetical protein